MKLNKSFKRSKTGLLSLCVAVAAAGVPYVSAQDSGITEEVVITGFRQSLQDAALAKRNAVNVTDSVFAEDIGKFADLNIAEAINRVPGMQLVREVDGSGVNISIRGLGTNFTKILMNDAPIAVATSGTTDSQNQNREVDLDLFPTELFTRLDVSKSPTASMLEGGLAGTVNMRTARPFDNAEQGAHYNYQLQGTYRELGEEISPRGAFLASWTNDTFGVLGGIAIAQNKVVTEGYETFGWTNPRLTEVQCGTGADATETGDCNTLGGNNWTIPATVPANVGLGLTEGAAIDNNFLTANNPGITMEQLANGLIPRLGRPHYTEGDRDRVSGLVSFEFRPNESSSYYLDILAASGDRDFNRLDMMLVGRNSALIPTNTQVDNNNVVTSADYANAQFFLEARPYKEDVDYLSVSPGAHFDLADDIALDAMAYHSESDWRREAPTIGVTTNLNSGLYAAYRNMGGDIPVANAFLDDTQIDLNDPNQPVGWGWERALIQNEDRETTTDGVHLNLTLGDAENNIKTGVHFDKADRFIQGSDGSADWENFACRGGFVPDESAENPDEDRPPCRGVAGSAVPNSAVSDYLIPSEAGFISVDYGRIFADTNYHQFLAQAEPGNGSATGAQSGEIEEETFSFYIESNGTSEVWDRDLRYNFGLRYVTTDQTVGAPSAADANIFAYVDTSYDSLLPSFNGAWSVAEDVIIRLSASQTLTRANPTSLLPRVNFSDPSAQNASQGNIELEPFKATNGDIGVEWYTGDEGYVSLIYFHKQISGFTVNEITEVTFNELSDLSGGGIVWNDLTDTQQNSIDVQGGPDDNVIFLSQPINGSGLLSVRGYEASWSQPLDMITEGLGFTANYTNIGQRSTGSVPAFITGTSESTINVTAYYEIGGLNARISYTWLDEQYASGLNQNGIETAQRFQQEQGQWDASAGYDFTDTFGVTLNLINFAGDPQRQIFSYDNAAYTFYDPGYQVILGVRGSF